jgi:hypothetical protein
MLIPVTHITTPPGSFPPYMHDRDLESSGVDGGQFTSGSWVTRVLNTEVTDTDSLGSLSANAVTIPSGTYYCQAAAGAWNTNQHQMRIYNTSDSATLLLGMNAHANPIGIGSIAFVVGYFTLAASKTIEVQHRCVSTAASIGLGQAASFGDGEVYVELELWQVST